MPEARGSHAISAPLKILLDRNLRDHGFRALSASRVQTLRWGDREHSAKIAGMMGKRLPALPKGKWLREQVLCLPTLASLTLDGRLALFTCTEIDVEEMRATTSFRNQFGDVFEGVPITTLPSAVERTYFHQTSEWGKYVSGDAVAAFLREFLLKLDTQHLPEIEKHMSLPEFDLRNLRNVGRFRELCKDLKTNDHLRDAFHLWTAEAHGLDYFVTGDQSFLNVMTKSTRANLVVRPISPAELLEMLGVPRLDPLPLEAGEYKDWLDALFVDRRNRPTWKGWVRTLIRGALTSYYRVSRAAKRIAVKFRWRRGISSLRRAARIAYVRTSSAAKRAVRGRRRAK